MPSRRRAQPRWSPLVWGALWIVSACEADVEVSTVALELHAPPGCELSSPSRFELRALGDFRTQREPFELGRVNASFESFPVETRELEIEGEFENEVVASGRTPVPSRGPTPSEPLPIVLLPEGASCPLGDPFLTPGEGSAVAPLPGGGFLMAGGTDADGRVRSSAIVLRAGRTLLEQVPDGMFLRRRDASATLVGEFIVVAGGVRELRDGAEDNYEVYDVRLGEFAGERGDELSAGARTEHGAALLPDGNLLLVGGRSEPGGAPLASAQLLRLEPPAPDQPGDLETARIAPQVLVLDSGAVLVAGGRDAQGVTVTTLERFEAAARDFVTLELRLPAFEHAVATGLPGGRLAWLGCDTRSRAACGLTLVLLRGEAPIAIDVSLEWAEHAPRGLTELRALALEDGRLLVTGRDPDGAMQSRAIVVDLGERRLESISATRAPTSLVQLEDGAIAELDRPGVSLRRIGSVSVYGSPEGDLLNEARPRALVDAPDRWQRSSVGWRALVTGARLDVPRLSLGDFRAELELRGGALVQLRAPDAPPLAVHVGTSEPAADGCERIRLTGRVALERRAGSLRVTSESSDRACSFTWSARGLVSFAVEAEADTVLQRLTITRL